MRTAFEEGFDFVIGNEGRTYTNDPFDSGGPTKFGVTLKAYSSFMGYDVGQAVIENLTEEQANNFYMKRYWLPLGCQRIAFENGRGCAIAIFDCGVLYGVGTTALLAQEALSGLGRPLVLDGALGEKSFTAFQHVKESDFISKFTQLILERVERIITINPKNERFRNGWIHRANRLLTLVGAHPSNKEDA